MHNITFVIFSRVYFQINADGTESALICYEVITPYMRSVCYDANFLVGLFIPYDPSVTNCTVQIDGTTCNSCTLEPCDAANGYQGPFWDCSNTILASLGTGIGNDCDGDFLLPIGEMFVNLPPLPSPSPSMPTVISSEVPSVESSTFDSESPTLLTPSESPSLFEMEMPTSSGMRLNAVHVLFLLSMMMVAVVATAVLA